MTDELEVNDDDEVDPEVRALLQQAAESADEKATVPSGAETSDSVLVKDVMGYTFTRIPGDQVAPEHVLIEGPNGKATISMASYEKTLEDFGGDKEKMVEAYAAARSSQADEPKPTNPEAPETPVVPAFFEETSTQPFGWTKQPSNAQVLDAVNGVGEKLDAFGRKVEAVESEVRAIDSRLTEQETSITALHDDVGELNRRTATVESTVKDFFNNAATVVVEKMSEPGVFKEAVDAILEPQIASVRGEVDQAQARADDAFDRANAAQARADQAYVKASAADSNPVAILACMLLGAILAYWAAGKISIRHDASVQVYLANLGVARVVLAIAGAALGYLVGCRFPAMESDNKPPKTSTPAKQPRKSTSRWEEFWDQRAQRRNQTPSAPAVQAPTPAVVAPANPPSPATPTQVEVVENKTEVLPAAGAGS